MAEVRLLIDYATGENWEMPYRLWERYEKDCVQLNLKVPPGYTCIQYWLTTLSPEESSQVQKKK